MDEIRFEGVRKSYDGQEVLRGFTAAISPGSAVALMGPSGSGKTTLARLLLGLESPDAGAIKGAKGLRFCPVFQEDRLCPGLTAAQNVALVLPRGEAGRAAAGLAAVGLTKEDLHKPAKELSGGQKRRVALVRAVEAAGDVLLLDESFKGLDEAAKQLAYAYIHKNLRGRTLLVITHDEREAEALCQSRIFIG